MARWQPARTDIIGEMADEILHNYRNARAVVGVDGVPGAGQDAFADDLAAALRERGAVAYRASVDAAADPDASTVRSGAIEPFRAGAAPYDEAEAGVLVLDGTRLHAHELLSAFVYTIWLSTPRSTSTDEVDPEQAKYEKLTAPRIKATANVDNTDPEHPHRTFADSC